MFVKNKEQIELEHPTWDKDNIFALCHQEDLDFWRYEILMSTSCITCGHEMGEHPFDKIKQRFICFEHD